MPEGMGQVSFASSVVNYFLMFAQLGIPTYGIRVCAQKKGDKKELTKTAKELIIINVITSAISLVVLLLSVNIIGRLTEIRTLILIYSLMIVSSVFEMSWLFGALEQYEYIAKRSIIIKAISVAAVFIFIRKSSDTYMYVAIIAATYVVTGIVNFIHARSFIDLRERYHYELRQHIKPIWIFFLMSVATTVYLNLDTLMLGFMTTDAEVGIYNAAVRIKALLTGVVTALGTVMLPRMSRLIYDRDDAAFLKYSSTAMEYIFIIAIPMALYFMIYSGECILLISGELYLGGTPAMQIIMPTLFFIGMTNILGIQILVPMGKEKLVLYSEIAGAVTDIILNAIFIPMYGAAGAALGTLFAEIAVFIFQMYYLRDRIRGIFASISYKKLILSNIFAICAIILIKYMDFRYIIVKLMLSSMAYFVVYFLMLLMLREKLVVQGAEYLKNALKSRLNTKQ